MTELRAIDEDRVEVPVDDQRVVGTLMSPDVPVPGILFVHGWGGDQAEDLAHAEELARLGCVCFTFDLRGHAESDAARDEVTRADGLDDVLAAYDYLARQPLVATAAIGVVGTSYGAYLAMLLTAHRPVRWLALRVPALYPDDHWDVPKAKLDKAAVRRYREHPPGPAEDKALAACAAFTGDALVVQSGQDDRIPPAQIAAIKAAFAQTRSVTHRLMPDATHAMRDPGQRAAYGRLLIRWLEDMVAASRHSRRAET